jgi:hypothetical protein
MAKNSKITLVHHFNFEMCTVFNHTVRKIKLDYGLIMLALRGIHVAGIPLNAFPSYILVKHGHCEATRAHLYVPTTLIDADYPKTEIFAYLCNYCGVDMTICEFDKFRITYELGFNIPNNFYPMQLRLFMDYLGLPAYCARVILLHKASALANGIDVTFEKDYTIQGKGSLLLRIMWHQNLQLDKYPCLFVMRSRFAKLGICVYSVTQEGILLTNLSNDLVYLGQRFVQICLPIPYIFEDGTCNYIDHTTNKLHDFIKIKYLDCKRKLKK